MTVAVDLTAESDSDHRNGDREVALAVGVSDGVRIGLPVAGVAVVAPGAAVDLGTAIGTAGDLEVFGDVLHNTFLLCKKMCCKRFWPPADDMVA